MNRETLRCITKPPFYAICKETQEKIADKSFSKILLWAAAFRCLDVTVKKSPKPPLPPNPPKQMEEERNKGNQSSTKPGNFSPFFFLDLCLAEAMDSSLI